MFGMRVWIGVGWIVNVVVILQGGAALEDDVNLQLHPDENRSEEKHHFLSNYTGWGPELAQRDSAGGRWDVTAPDGAVLETRCRCMRRSSEIYWCVCVVVSGVFRCLCTLVTAA